MSGPFDFFDSSEEEAPTRSNKPIWAFDLDDENNAKDIKSWMNGEVQFLESKSRERVRLMRRNLMLYRGIQYETQDTRRDLRDRSIDRSRNIRKIVVNHIYDLSQNRISRLLKFKPAVEILPTNDEFEDSISASVTKSLLDHIWYIREFQSTIVSDIATYATIMGEGYLFIEWDPDSGDIHPDSPEDGERVPLLNGSGAQEHDKNGNAIYIEKPVKTGDVSYETVMPFDVLFDQKKKWDDVNYIFRRKVMPVEEARLRWPDKAADIKASENQFDFDLEDFSTRRLDNEVILWEFWHKDIPELPRGRKIVFTNNVVLENVELPYSHGKLPIVKFTDIDVPGLPYGVSFMETVKGLTSSYNNVTNLIQRNQFLVSHPKWIFPAGSVRLESLGNDITMVQYKGPTPPVLAQMNPTPNEIFNYRKELKEDFQQISGIFGVSRGEPPAGVKSGVALQFLNEQENERFNQSIVKWNAFVQKTAIMTLSVAGDYYESDDDRMIRVLGKNDKWKSLFFDADNLSKDYDVRVQNSSALPQSKAARIQTIIDLAEKFPDIVSSEQIVDMIDLGKSEKFVKAATVALRTAEAENELILNGEKTAGVVEYEDHIQHWSVHIKALNEYSFKETTPVKIQDKFKDHVLVHEMFMAEKARKNPVFADKLSRLDQFPVFFELPPEPQELPLEEESLTPSDALPGAFSEEEAPVNPDLGGEPQALNQPDVPNVAEQTQGAEPSPGLGPVA